MRRRELGAGLAGLLVVLALPAPAPAAQTIGQTGPPLDCGTGKPFMQRQVTTGPSYSPSADGVITSWSASAGLTANRTLKLLVLRPDPGTGPNNFVVTQKDELRVLTQTNQLNTFSGMSLPIRADERLGLYSPAAQPGGMGYCAFDASMASDKLAFTLGPLAEPGLGASVNFFSTNPIRLNASAVVEPDADHDGFGDESQDCAPDDPARHDDCAPPQTTITKQPNDKTKKKQATFEFSSNEPGSTFECSLDGGPFADCNSPDTLKVKKGRHSFAVRAKDAAGNVDGSPASDDWKVKKKKK